MIDVQNLVKEFTLSKKEMKQAGVSSNRIQVVNKISFNCRPGRVFSLLGPNGAGKTTTLRMIATILKPTSGSITVAGFDATQNPNGVRSKIGFLTGSTGLYDRLTPNEIIRYFADLYGMPRRKMKARRSELFELLGVHEFANKKIGALSTGMKQKVSIVRTMIHDPQVVVFDEPTSGLDVITAENIIRLVGDCRDAGKTVIFSSHIMSEVDLLADDLAIIHKGHLIFNDTMDNFRAQMEAPTLTKEFIRRVSLTNPQTASA
ncbi:MAG: ATP-binding cassette domain-containing protein [Bacteroidota bacterium]